MIQYYSLSHRPPDSCLYSMQWSDSTALDVIHHILSDKSDARCFFVGSYRSNEVSSDHDIFDFIQDLESSEVSTRKLILDGMKSEDVNALISDALCTFPRTTRRLSTITHEKTQGSKSQWMIRSFVINDANEDLDLNDATITHIYIYSFQIPSSASNFCDH